MIQKKYCFRLLLSGILLLGMAIPNFAAIGQDPQVQFDVSAQKDVTANAIQVNFVLQKKASNLESASNDLQNLAKRVYAITNANQIPSSDVQIQNTYMASSNWLFGKDYVVSATAKITLRNLTTWSKVAKQLSQLDSDMAFSDVSYSFPNSADIWKDLLASAVKEGQDRKTQYEQQLHIKLKLASLRDFRSQPFDSMAKVGMMVRTNSAAEADLDPSTTLPTEKFQLTLSLGYSIDR